MYRSRSRDVEQFVCSGRLGAEKEGICMSSQNECLLINVVWALDNIAAGDKKQLIADLLKVQMQSMVFASGPREITVEPEPANRVEYVTKHGRLQRKL